MIDTWICTRCERDTNPEIAVDCGTCRVYRLCPDCAKVHEDTCLARIRTRRIHVPRIPDSEPTAMPAPARASALDSPVLWIVVVGGAFAAALARVLQ